MKEHPILFTGVMVRAILEGRKTQTRRVVKVPDIIGDHEATGFSLAAHPREGHSGKGWYCYDSEYSEEGSELVTCPYGEKGHVLWVREAFALGTQPGQVFYKADRLPGHADTLSWKPSIHMPKVACRLRLQVVSTMPERLRDISEEDAKAEGHAQPTGGGGLRIVRPDGTAFIAMSESGMAYQTSFAELWNDINAKRGHPWSSNPWVWRIVFRRVET